MANFRIIKTKIITLKYLIIVSLSSSKKNTIWFFGKEISMPGKKQDPDLGSNKKHHYCGFFLHYKN